MNASQTRDVDGQTTGIYINLVVGTTVLIATLLAFEVLRRRIPSVYEGRRYMRAQGVPLGYYRDRVQAPASPSYALFGWISSTVNFSLNQIAETHGLDYALFLRFLRLMIFLFLALLVPAFVLIPIFATASNKDLPKPDHRRTIGIQQWTLANVASSDSWRFWAVLVLDYVITILAIIFLYFEFSQYAKCRIQYRASKNPANYAILVREIPPQCSSRSQIHRFWNNFFPSAVFRIFLVFDGSQIVAEKEAFWSAVAARERAEWRHANDPELAGRRPTHRVRTMLPPRSEEVDTIDYWDHEQKTHRQNIENFQQDDQFLENRQTRCAFVVFKERFTASIAAQTIVSKNKSEWRVQRAPEPSAINWGALGVSSYQHMFRRLLTVSIISAFTLLWIIPISFIMGLTNLTALANLSVNSKEPFKFLQGFTDWPPLLVGFFESIIPSILLSLLLKYIPNIFRVFVMISRIPSLALIDRRTRDWFFNFLIFSNFVFILITGSAFNKLVQIVKDPAQIASYISSSAPIQGAFVTNFVIFKGLAEETKEILQIGRLFLRWLKLRRAVADREIVQAEIVDSKFDDYEHYALAQLVAALGLTYSTLTPYIVPVCLGFFAVTYLVFKYNLVYTKWNPYSSGGSFYGGALYAVWIGLVLHIITMMVILGLNNRWAQCALMVVLLALAITFLIYLFQTVHGIAEHGSLEAVALKVNEQGGSDCIPDDVAEQYEHPGLKRLTDHSKNKRGVDGKPQSPSCSDGVNYEIVQIDNNSPDCE